MMSGVLHTQAPAASQGYPGVQFFTTSPLSRLPDKAISERVDTCHFYLVLFQLCLYAAAPKNKIDYEWFS